MWLSFHSSTQVGKGSHIEIGQDPWRRNRLPGWSSAPVSAASELRQTENALEAAGSVWAKWFHQGKRKWKKKRKQTSPLSRPPLVFQPCQDDKFLNHFKKKKNTDPWECKQPLFLPYPHTQDQMVAEWFFGVILLHIRFFRQSHLFQEEKSRFSFVAYTKRRSPRRCLFTSKHI